MLRSSSVIMDEKINDFLTRYALDQHSDEEHERFMDWLHTASDVEIAQALEKFPHLQEMYTPATVQHEELTSRIEGALDASGYGKGRIISLFSGARYRAAAVAAILALIVGTGWWYFSRPRNAVSLPVATAKPANIRGNPVEPGGNKASLTLADGSTIVLDDAANGLLTVQNGIQISKTENGRLYYDASHSSPDAVTGFNTISTPRGGQYQLLLPDGTQVWLNAASSLKFPAAFSRDERRVELTGEAYFEVAKETSRPFRVVSGNQAIEVLGTHFNVNAYQDDNDIRTTLLEGSVKVSQTDASLSKILKPGQQAVVKENIVISTVDAKQAIAWKNGYFIFSHENIKNIMQKISRWYDVDVSYEGAVTKEAFIGSMSRFENVSDVLDMLQSTGSVHFKTEGRKITVLP